MSTADALLVAEDLHRSYRRRGVRGTAPATVKAVAGVSFHLDRAAGLGIVGGSGSGKSTLARLLLALEDPDRGTVRFEGHPISTWPESRVRPLRRRFQAVFQDPSLSLDPCLRVGTIIAEPLAAHAIGNTAGTAALILGAVILSHFVTDQVVYLGGRWLRPRLGRFPRIEARLASTTGRLAETPGALLGLVPARVLPLGRGAWLAACGVVRVPWIRFASVDLAALVVHLAVWSGLGWWFAGDLGRLAASTDTGRVAGVWLAVTLITVITMVILWRSRQAWQPRTVRTVRRAGRSLRRFGRGSQRP